MTTDDLAAARAYLDHEKHMAGLTDDQRATLAKRRQILGSLDDTYALNRDERGCGTLAAAIYIALPMGAIWALYLGHTVIAAVLCYVTVAVSVAQLLGHMMRRDDQDEWEQYVEEAIDLASMPLTERIAAAQAPEMVREIEDHLREVGK